MPREAKFEFSDNTVKFFEKMCGQLAGQLQQAMDSEEAKDLEFKAVWNDMAKAYRGLYDGLIEQGFEKSAAMEIAIRLLRVIGQ